MTIEHGVDIVHGNRRTVGLFQQIWNEVRLCCVMERGNGELELVRELNEISGMNICHK